MKKLSSALLVMCLLGVIVLGFSACQKFKVANLKANSHFKTANKYYSEEKYKKAVSEYEEALKLNPNFKAVYFYLGTAYAMLYKPGDDTPNNKELAANAKDYLQKALDVDPNNKDIILALGDINDKTKNFEEAEKYFLKVLENNPNDPKIYSVLADFYTSYNKGDKAVEMFQKRIDLNPNDPEGYLFLARYYFDRKKWDDAMKYQELRLQKIQQLTDLDEKEKTSMLADAYYRVGHLCWAHSYQTPPDLMAPKERQAIIDKGLAALQKAAELEPNYPDPWSYMGLLNVEKDKIDSSRHDEHWKERDRLVAKFTELRKLKIASEEFLKGLQKEK